VKKILFLVLVVLLYSKNVLIINSYSMKLLWTKEELEGIFSVLKDKPNINLYIEFMDTKVFRPTPERLKLFYKYLKSKYKNTPVDIIITTDDNALNFVRKYKIFKNAKVFFCGVNNLNLKLNRNLYAGVFEKKEPLENLKLLEKVVPNLKYVYVVSDDSTSGNSVLKEYKEALRGIKKYKFIYVNSKSLEEILAKIRKATNNSGMLLLTPLSFYLNNEHINYKYAIALISEYFNHPIVIHSDLYLKLKNNNIVGGKVTDGYIQGKIVAQKVLEYLNGKSMRDIGFTYEKANTLYLNVKNLEKFGINAYDLGYKDAVYINKPDTFYFKYRNWIISFFTVFVMVIIFSIVLFFKNRQLRKYNVKISKLNKELEDKIFNVISVSQKKQIYNDEKVIKFIRNFIFQFKYPIEKLKGDSFEVNYLKEKIFELENLIMEDSCEEVFLKNILKEFNYEIKGSDLKIYANKEKIKNIFEGIFKVFEKELNDCLKEIKLVINGKNLEIKLFHNCKKSFLDKIFASLYLYIVSLKYFLSCEINFVFNEKFFVLEIQFN